MVDINCDVGESYGAYTIGNDAGVIPYIDSCNIACGFHGGDPATIWKTIGLALDNQVKIGAHPGYPDITGFGRRAMNMSLDDFEASIYYQVGAIKSMVESRGGKLHHVKPHGAMYQFLNENSEYASLFLRICERIQSDLIVFAFPGGALDSEASSLSRWKEGFADRRYGNNGRLVPRSHAEAVITDPVEAVEQVNSMIHSSQVKTISGEYLNLEVSTLCIHGDNPSALAITQALSQL